MDRRKSDYSSSVHIGDGSVVGAETVATKDVHPYAVVGGDPVGVLLYRNKSFKSNR